jgi:hypothetical protein
MSQLTPLLRQITKKASHPNQLLYGVQLERARVKYLVRGELGDGKEAVALGAPEEVKGGKEKEGGRQAGGEDGVEDGEGGGVGMEAEQGQGGGEVSREKDG